MSYYNIDYNAAAWQDLPVRLRQSIMYAWMKANIIPVLNVAGQFNTNRNNDLYELAHNSQVCYMEAALNDTFDNVLRRIYIGDPVYDDPLWVYLEDEDKPVWVGLESEVGSTPYPDPEWVWLESEIYSGGGVQFIVNVPVAVVFDINRMKALINQYRLPSKNNYIIVTF